MRQENYINGHIFVEDDTNFYLDGVSIPYEQYRVTLHFAEMALQERRRINEAMQKEGRLPPDREVTRVR